MKSHHSLLKVVSLLFVLAVVLVPAASASAALRICRTDPIIFFADGQKLSVTASIGAPVEEVTQIVYEVHAPVGSQVSKVVNTAGGLGLEETVQVYADQPEGQYTVDTVVQTAAQGVDVTAITRAIGGAVSTASGRSFEHLVTSVNILAAAPQN